MKWWRSLPPLFSPTTGVRPRIEEISLVGEQGGSS